MITEEVKNIFNRMMFIKNELNIEKSSNLLLLISLITEKGSEITDFLHETCTADEIVRFRKLIDDLLAGEAETTLDSVTEAIKKSQEKIDEFVHLNDNGNINIKEFNCDDALMFTLKTATTAKQAIMDNMKLGAEIPMDSLMIFFGFLDNQNQKANLVRNQIDFILDINEQILGERIMIKFNPNYTPYLWNKRKSRNTTEAISLDEPDSNEEIAKRIINGLQDDMIDDDLTEDDIIRRGTEIKVCNMIDLFVPVDTVKRDEYVEKVATLMCQNGNKLIAIVGEKGSGLSTFKYLLNEYFNQRYSGKFQNLHYFKGFAFNTEYVKTELYKGNDSITGLFFTIGNFISQQKGFLFIDDLDDMFEVEKEGLTELSITTMCDWSKSSAPTIVATMTPEHYSEYIEKSEKLKSMFVKVEVPVMSDDDVLKCFDIKKKDFEHKFLCKTDKDTLQYALKLSRKYVKTSAVPKSLFRTLDIAGSLMISKLDAPSEITDIERKYFEEQILDIETNKSKAELKGSSFNMDKIYEDSEKARKKDTYKLGRQIKAWQRSISKENIKLTKEAVEQAISMLTGVPSDQMNEDELAKVRSLGDKLRSAVIGQDEAIDVVVRTLKRRAVGLSANKSKTIGNLIFCGESGVGKTELAKQLAKYMFGDEKNMVRIDMSEYSERHSMSKLIGTTAGFVGYENDGILTKAVREKKFCVVLLDEMEKSAPEIFNLFLQVFDDGRLTTGQGELVDFSNTIIIMTSNVGARKSQELGDGIGFYKKSDYKSDIIEKELKSTFQPEFLNRIDNIVTFNHLSDSDMEKITRLQLNRLVKTVAETGRKLSYTEEVVKFISKEAGKEANMGARPINRAIQNMIEVPLADLIVDSVDKITDIDVFISEEGNVKVVKGFEVLKHDIPEVTKKKAGRPRKKKEID